MVCENHVIVEPNLGSYSFMVIMTNGTVKESYLLFRKSINLKFNKSNGFHHQVSVVKTLKKYIWDAKCRVQTKKRRF